MGLLTIAELSEVRAKALETGLATKREALVAWFDPAVQAQLPGEGAPNPASALALDLAFLNQLEEPSPDGLFLAIWLREASANCVGRPAAQKFFSEMAERAAQRGDPAAKATVAAAAAPPAPPPVPGAPVPAPSVPEKILFRSTLLPDSFIALAALRARSVARLTVPRVVGGAAQMTVSGKPAGVFGTGWLIGPQYLLTNWHVVRARSTGEEEPPRDDIDRQVAGIKVEFDYISDDIPPEEAAVERLVHGDPVLDYALVKLAAPSGREPLPLLSAAVEVNAEDPFAANVIQHPGGAARQFAIRNNLAAVRQGDDLAYFTDTAGGSSGSPVLNDAWQVVALHKASTPKFGDFSFQGKSTTWVNVGTVIAAVVADLQAKAGAEWAQVGAKLV
ncbi:MAG: trypsin-like peptidase domain-containing protein [Novosphingobium sp.]